MNSENILEMRGIKKKFPGVLALDDVNLELKKGEVLALLGENGAGKSTLIKILAGAYCADAGNIVIDGETHKFDNPAQAMTAGISVMYQELNNIDELSIAENIFLGNLPEKGIHKQIDYKKLKEQSEEILKKVGFEYDPFTEVSKLSIAEKQMVEIAKAFSKNFKVLVMDEPTSALNDKEIDILFKLVKRIVASGKSVIYISHRLDEVFQLSDRVQVMRDGKKVFVGKTEDLTKQELISYMVGREITDMYPKSESVIGDPLLEVQGLSSDKVKNIDLSVKKGEIVGFFGLMGAGRGEVMETLFGIKEMKSGVIKIDGKVVDIRHPGHAKQHGLAYIPSDRKAEGLMLCHSVSNNITISIIDKLKKLFKIDSGCEKKLVAKWVKSLNIKTPSINTLADSLSGGNQQKVVLAKWMATQPKILFMNEPTRGIDVGAKTEIYKLMEDFCKEGLGILMISSDLPEVLGMADRVIVMHEGRIAGELTGEDITQEKIMEKAVGGY